MRLLRLLLPFLSIALILAGSVVLYYLSPERIIALFGVQNAYVFQFFLSVAGGLTVLITIPYHFVLITLAAGGLNPYLLALVTTVGLMAGDSTSYWVGRQSGAFLPPRLQAIADKLLALKETHPRLTPVAIFLYGAAMPFSNDVVTVPMGMARYPYWRVIIPLGLGNFVFNVTLALLSVYAYSFLQNWVW